MKRDLEALSNTEFDVVVIGAGIYGVATAWDAALRGLKVALVDQGDLGNATSANSLKIIHGGLRYLQNFDIKRMRESINERMVMMRIAPHLIYPMPVIMPTYSNKMKSRPAMAMALIANDIIGFDRNQSADPHKFMPRGFTISKKEVQKYVPGYTKYNLNGGAIWYDCQCYNTERLLLSFVLSAAEQGAQVGNYLKAVDLLHRDHQVTGVKVEDQLTGAKIEIRAKMVVNNAGPWVDTILANLNGKAPEPKFKLSTAMNLVVKRKLLKTHAAGLSGPYRYVHPDGKEYKSFRMLFFAPWRDYTIIGTNHLPYPGTQENYKVTENEIQDFLGAVNKAYPGVNIQRSEVSFFYGGFLPMAAQNPVSGEVMLQRHYKIFDHAKTDQTEGLLSIVGVKYTTARDVAQRTVDLIFQKSGQTSPACLTKTTALYGGEIDRFEEFTSRAIKTNPYQLKAEVMRHLCYNYGSRYHEILQYGQENPNLVKTLPNSKEVLQAEVIHAVRAEMAVHLADVVLRRTDLGSGENPGVATLEKVAEIMGKELGWNKARQKEEIEAVQKNYVPA